MVVIAGSCFGLTLQQQSNTGVAQLVEHWSPKPGVGSSSLSSRAKLLVI